MLSPRSLDTNLIFALVKANQQRMVDDVSSTYYHKAKSGTTGGDFSAPTFTQLAVSAANGTNLATALVLIADLQAKLNSHFKDVAPHNTSTSAQITDAVATTTAAATTVANNLKSFFNTHAASTAVHYNAAATVATADATDQTTLDTLINAMKTAVNSHFSNAPNGYYVNPVAP